MKTNSKASRKQKGATLIEALVSIVVMSFGLLGLAGLQVNAMAYQQSAWATQRVAELTSNFSERLRTNTGAVYSDYIYSENYQAGNADAPTVLGCRTSGTCTAAQIAADDIADVLTKAQSILPGGSIQVEGTADNGFVFTALYFDKQFVDSTGALQTSASCSASTSGIDWRNCCPVAAAAPAGVRCRRFAIIP